MLTNERFTRTVDQVFCLDEFKAALADGRKLRIKYGVDVTAPFLHIGHAVNLWMMRLLQDAGHRVVFLIGDFTTRIGDPTGKSQTRPVIPLEEINVNARLFLKQVSTVLRTDPEVFEVRRNSEWYDDMGLADFVRLLAQVTHGRLIQRDMFQKRIASATEIYLHELLYPVLQGYDSVMLESDLTIVGSDQLFNEMMGRFFQERAGQRPQIVMTTRITMGTDGKNKQSKSLNNYIALADSETDKFGKVMSLPDSLIPEYLEVYTALPEGTVAALAMQAHESPMEAKLALAEAIVCRYHGECAAKEERARFVRVFSQRETPGDMPTIAARPRLTVLDLLAAADPSVSRSEYRRLLSQNAVKLEGQILKDPIGTVQVPLSGLVLKIGKRRWFRVIPEPLANEEV